MRVRISNIESKTNIQAAICVLPISVGQPYHEGEIFEGTLKLIKTNFQKCIIVLADTLQRYNFLIENLGDTSPQQFDSETRAMADAKEAGDQWLQRNQPFIDEHLDGFSYEILRWNECLAYPGFSQKLSLLDSHYQNRSSDFSRSINKICGQRIAGYLKTGMLDSANDSHIPVVRNLVKSYVCEEAAIMLEWRDLGYQYMAYPTNHNPINKEIFDCLGSILQKNDGMELLNIEISEVRKIKKTKKQVPLTSLHADNISLTDQQSQELKKAIRGFIPLAINPIFTALKYLDDPSLTLLFLREVQEQILAIEENAKKTSASTVSDNLLPSFSSTTSSAMFHSLPDSSSDQVSFLNSLNR